jgi:hypothetical protein
MPQGRRAESTQEKSVPTIAEQMRAPVEPCFGQVARWTGYRRLSCTDRALVKVRKGMEFHE